MFTQLEQIKDMRYEDLQLPLVTSATQKNAGPSGRASNFQHLEGLTNFIYPPVNNAAAKTAFTCLDPVPKTRREISRKRPRLTLTKLRTKSTTV